MTICNSKHFILSFALLTTSLAGNISHAEQDKENGALLRDTRAEKLRGEFDKNLAAEKGLSYKELTFLNETVDLHIRGEYDGGRRYSGWYPGLNRRSDPEESKLVVAYVHTDAEHAAVLQVGTGHPGLMVVAIDNGTDRSLYGGPVSNYYSFKKPLHQRMTDEKWKALIRKKAPPKPAFTKKYWVVDHKTRQIPNRPSATRRFNGL
ncbi:MAG: DUF3160 domain-containing protein [Proteobacteria bacterium]|nr:DUF3160 domain-containing protein [Pseudomonadota bacterium]